MTNSLYHFFFNISLLFSGSNESNVLKSGQMSSTNSPFSSSSSTPLASQHDTGFTYRSTNTLDGMHPDSITQSTDDVTLGLATRFMDANKIEAHKNFGTSADNMTAVVCTIYPSAVI
jgi:hypothetical protein